VTVRVLHRPARAVQPVRAQAPLRVEAPPTMSDGKGAGGLQSLLPLLGAGVSMSVMVFARGSSFAAIGAIVMVVSVGAAGALVLTQRGQAGRKRRAQRETYLDYLDGLRDELRAWEEEYRARAMEPDPAPDRLLDLVRDPARLWERRRTDPDFLHVRLGTGAVAAREVDVQSSASMSTPADPFMVAEAQGLVRRFSEVRDVPLRVPLDRVGDVSVIGGREPVLEAARAVLAQVVSLHSAEDVRVAVLCAPERLTDWAWVRWLPHVTAPGRIGPAGPQPLVASTPEALVELLAEDLAQRASLAAKTYRQEVGGADTARANGRLLVVDDCHGNVAQVLLGDAGVPLAELGITVLHLVADRLQEPGEVSARLTCDDEGSVLVERVGAGAAAGVSGTRDIVSLDQADALARELAPLRLSADSYDDGYSTSPANFSELLGITDPEDLDVASWWRRRSDRDFLRVPIGVDSAGRPVLLDLKESSQLGMGPHGLCVGATGSGKSELLRTMVLALALTHPPEQLALVLVDYKGGATFAPFESLPHVAGLITNLIADDTLVERMYSSLEGEVTRRQQVLAAADKSVDITEYALRREERGAPAAMPALPHLVVFIDEFGELLSAKPEFIELFLKIGRIGRSIGVHLLLSSQRIESGKLRGLDTYLSYRLGLRTLSEMESRTVLDTPDAFHLPAVPGFGYLKVDVTVYEQFKAAYVSGPLQHEADPAAPAAAPRVVAMAHYGSRSPAVGATAAQEPGATARSTGPTLASTVITALVRAGDRVAPIWLPPLPDAVTLGTVGGGWVVEHGRGVQLRSTAPTHGLSAPVGLLDDPARQEQRTWLVDLDDGGGNLAVLGGPGSGKSTALRTLALGLAASHTPEQVGIYGVDLLGSSLRPLEELPHVGGVAGRDDRERVRRTVDEVHAVLTQREVLFRRLRLDGPADLRRARADGRLPELSCTDVVLLVDGYGQLGVEFEPLERKIHELVERGGRMGVHVVVTARRWNEVRGAQQVAFGNRVELRMAEPAESSLSATVAKKLPRGRPGRAITTGEQVGQWALPRLDTVSDTDLAGLGQAAELLRGAWTGTLPAPVRVLPDVLPAADVVPDLATPGVVALGRFEDDFSPATLDVDGGDQHLLALGDTASGKTNLLRMAMTALADQYTPDELVFAVFDPRRGLRGAVHEDYVGGYADTTALATQLAGAVAGELAQRDTAPDGGPLPPRVVLVVDDHDVLGGGGTFPLAAFTPHLASSRDLRLTVLMTRRVLGAGRALFEPFTLGVRESGALVLLLSGDPSEGALFPGVRPRVLPAGRAQVVRTGVPTRTAQIAWCPVRQESS